MAMAGRPAKDMDGVRDVTLNLVGTRGIPAGTQQQSQEEGHDPISKVAIDDPNTANAAAGTYPLICLSV